MAVEYSVETCRRLEDAFRRAELLRPMRVDRYDAGTELVYDVTGVAPAARARVRLEVGRFVGGGFAGQVYRVRLLDMDGAEGAIAGLEPGGIYAIKIMVPPSGFARKFRDAMYAVGFQGPFSLQSNPAAVRAGALWQKLIRRAAAIRFGDERAVVDIFGTFVDDRIGSCGEIREWVEGRNWRFEVDDHLEARTRWARGEDVPADQLASPEYRTKKRFMAEFVRLLHEMGAPELARQYEWWTCKSQPNAMKRLDTDGDPEGGLTAVDFRAGLTLLPFLPMSPGDVPLILKGIARGSLVQFDRGDLAKLERFMDTRAERFADLRDALAELTAAERQYRDSLPDVAHHHVRLLYSRRLWSGIFDGAVTSWKVRNIADERTATPLRKSRLLTLLFFVAGLLPTAAFAAGVALFIAALATGNATWGLVALAVAIAIVGPIPARLVRRIWGRADCRRHYARALTSPGYFRRTVRGRTAEKLTTWVRSGRVSDERAGKLIESPLRFFCHLPLSVLPAGLHRFFTDGRFAAEKLRYVFVRPVRLLFNPEAREQWLRDMVSEGRRKGMLSDEDAGRILSRIKEPFIQKYLQSLAVHVCTLPITQIVSVAVAIWYVAAHPELSWGQAWAAALVILGAFQVTPISPGSMVRGLYVVYLVIRERNFKDYNIAVFLGFFKYVGYLAFPVQMAYRYPALARFMAAHWATEAVHVVPVFGEHGALLEHGIFDLFYNRMLTIRRRMRQRAERRAARRPRSWHLAPVVLAGSAAFVAVDLLCAWNWGALPMLKNIWAPAIVIPLLIGAAAAVWAGGAALSKRILLTVIGGAAVGLIFGAIHLVLGHFFFPNGWRFEARFGLGWDYAMLVLWRVFLFGLLSVVGAFIAETRPVRE
ncbi:MAG TPA: hypothetical protein VMZ50_08860 [Phycisphaerae bacterium]|nr:hypothetical protein [Phycisphaerae bacterium]